jgi:hypothetical protein
MVTNNSINDTTGQLIVTAGDVNIQAGNLDLANTNSSGTQGIINFGGSPFISNFGINDVFIGGAGNLSTTGNNNIGIGLNALNGITSGTFNCGIGTGACQNVTTGFFNFAIGGFTLNVNTTGAENTGVGVNSLRAMVSGNGNVGIGTSSLNQAITGSSNIGIGLGAGTNYTGAESNNVVLNHAGVVGESNVIRLGSGSTTCYIAGIQGASYSAGSPTPTLPYIDTSDGQLVSAAPVASSSATSTFGSLVVGTALQNTANYAIHVNVCVVVTVAVGATIVMGVGSTNTPTTNTIIPSFSVAGTFTFSAIVPSKYYLLVNTTGSPTVTSITTQSCQVG